MPVRYRSPGEIADTLAAATSHIAGAISIVDSRIANADGVPVAVAEEAQLAALILGSQNDRLIGLIAMIRNLDGPSSGMTEG